MAPSKFFPLPLELLCEIIKFLTLKDLKMLSLASRLARSQAIRFIFGHLRYTCDLPPKVRKIYQARKDVKEVIKKLELLTEYIPIGELEDSLDIFQFLETLPNLQVLCIAALVPQYISQFISSIRHTTLLELVLHTSTAPVEGPPTAGLTGLEKLSIVWNANDNPNEPGSSIAHLYEFIRPTLTTLVELRLDTDDIPLDVFDLRLLKPTADTLRTFEYTLVRSADDSILDTIPAILPYLTKLSISWDFSENHPILWKETHIQALSKNNNLIDLTLSSDFEVNARDTAIADNDYAWFVRCYKRRLKATQDISSACPQLQRCNWVHMGIDRRKIFNMSHSFVVEERMAGGNVTRVVRGIKQPWMGRDYDTRHQGGGIVKCKLEDLPGDIIGRNDVE